MKRGRYDSSYYGGGGQKRPRSTQFEVRLLIDSRVAGSVIGKSGCNIKKLRAEYSTQIRLPDCLGPERVMFLSASTIDSAVSTLGHAIPLMSEEAIRFGAEFDRNKTIDTPQELRFLIHESIVGKIIGKGGSKIKEIRSNSGATVKAYNTCAPQSSDRVVSVSGSSKVILLALKEIFTIVNTTAIIGMVMPYDPHNYDVYYANEYGGYGEGHGEGYGPSWGGGYNDNYYNDNYYNGPQGYYEGDMMNSAQVM